MMSSVCFSVSHNESVCQGFNKRATVLYLLARFEESIEDCKVVVEMQVDY